LVSIRPPFPAELADRYEVDREIGQGGMAVVWRARDIRHDSQVAIKILKQELVAALGGERFTREIRITAALQHPNILPLLDSGEAGGLPFYVMPFVNGMSLAQRVQFEGALPIAEAVRLVAEVADGLAYAHSLGLIHRDLKPANILQSQGHALLADFGIARILETTNGDALTESGLALGTAAYMAPEQAAGERVDSRADIYALGCVLYELLTGSPPFTGSNQRAIMARHAMDPVPSVRTVRREVPRALEVAITRALAKTPADRYQTAAEFRTAILVALETPDRGGEAMPIATRRMIGAFAVIAVLAGIAIWKAPRQATTALDPNRVMVYPLVIPSDWTGSRSMGEDVSTMIGSAMDGAGSLRWIDGWQQLPPAKRDDMRALADAEANAVARTQRCRYVITGRLAMRGADSAEVILSLRDLATDSVMARPQSVALTGEAWRAGLRAVTAMLPSLIPSGTPQLDQSWTDRDPKAVAQFLAGEAAFRRLKLDEAITRYRAAVDADSTFGLAASRGAAAASWAHRPADGTSFLRVAMAHARTPRDRAFAAGLQAFEEGRADSAATAFRAAVALDPSLAVAWMQLGETYMHLLPAAGRTDSLAADAFARASAIDSGAAHILYHQVEIAARSSTPARADTIGAKFMAIAVDTLLLGNVEAIRRCATNQWTADSRHEFAYQKPQSLFAAAKAVGQWLPMCGRAAYTELLHTDTLDRPGAVGRRFYSLVGLEQLYLGRGAADSAAAIIDAYQARWNGGRMLYLLAAPVEPAMAAKARQVEQEDALRYGEDYRGNPYSLRLWALGVWAVYDGRLSVADAVAANLMQRATESHLAIDSLRAESVMAHAALARADTAAALRRLRAIVRRPVRADDVAFEEGASLGLERLTLGRLLVRRREFAEARDVLEVLDSAAPAYFGLYMHQALLLRAEALDALGDAQLAADLRRRARLGAS
jgi:tetratricopeptide (TPR) repeat protein